MSNLMKKMPLTYDTYHLQESINEAIRTTCSYYDDNLDDDGEMEDNIFTSLLPILLLLIFCIGIFFNVFFIKLLIITILFTPISLTLSGIIITNNEYV
jgi:hypothetical protein